MIRVILIRLGAIAVVMLVVFLLAAALHLPLLDDPRPYLPTNRLALGAVTTGLLVADIVLPAPSSLLMIANGAVFGLWLGALASILGSMGCALVGYWLGRTGRIAGDDRGRAFLDRWGMAAVAASRPVPLLAEAVAIVAGSAGLPVARFTVASLAGVVPASLIYAWAGAESGSAAGPALPFAITLALAGALWVAGRLRR